MSRLASNWASARPLSFLVTFECLLQSFQNVGRRVLLLRLGIQRQHPELVRLIAHEIDDTQPATLARAFTPPAEFPYTARAANYRSHLRALDRKSTRLNS